MLDSVGTRPGTPSCQLDLKARESAAHLTHSHADIARGNQAKICFRSELWPLKRKLFSFNQPFYFVVVAFV